MALHLGELVLEGGAALAPMAGVADRAFRQICRKFGAVYTVGELTSARGLLQGSRKTEALLEMGPEERPGAVQLFGDDPEAMARGAEAALRFSPQVIDLNMGCPAPKIAGNRAGAALMKEPELAARIIRAVKSASPVPVTVKFRKGWDEGHINAVEFARMAQESGADAITVHGRTRAQMYAPPADWDILRQVKAAVSIPVIGNGDVVSAIHCEEAALALWADCRLSPGRKPPPGAAYRRANGGDAPAYPPDGAVQGAAGGLPGGPQALRLVYDRHPGGCRPPPPGGEHRLNGRRGGPGPGRHPALL